MKNQTLTNKEIRKAAAALGYVECSGYSKNQLIFKKKRKYISYDYTSHNGGFWKVASSAEKLSSKDTRDCTANMLLEFIGD